MSATKKMGTGESRDDLAQKIIIQILRENFFIYWFFLHFPSSEMRGKIFKEMVFTRQGYSSNNLQGRVCMTRIVACIVAQDVARCARMGWSRVSWREMRSGARYFISCVHRGKVGCMHLRLLRTL